MITHHLALSEALFIINFVIKILDNPHPQINCTVKNTNKQSAVKEIYNSIVIGSNDR